MRRSHLVLFAIIAVTASLRARSIEPRPIAGGTFEASAAAHAPGRAGVLFSDDGRNEELFWLPLDDRGNQTGRVRRIPLGTSITDMEGMTFDGSYHYVVGSQSKRTGVSGDGMARFRFEPRTERITGLERVAGLKAWLADHVEELRGTGAVLGDAVLNIEAAAWDPAHQRLLLGLRAPVVDGQALVVPLRLKDPQGPFAKGNLQVDGSTIRLPLDGDGIRSLEFDRGRFRLIAGASLDAEDRDFRIMEWNGDAARPTLRELGRLPRTLKPEGIAGALAEDHPRVLVFDTSRFALLPW